MPESTALFYLVDGKRQDADLHNPILSEGDHDAARAVSRRLLAKLGLPPSFVDPLIDKAKLQAIREAAQKRRLKQRALNARERAEALLHGKTPQTRAAEDVDYIQDPHTGRFQGSRPHGGSHIQTVPVGLGIPDDTPFSRAGISVVSYKDAEKVVANVARATGANVRTTHQLIGGWTDPETKTYYPEPTLVTEFDGQPEDIRYTAEAIAHVLGPQREIWVVNDGEGLPNARDLRLDVMPSDNKVTAQQLSDIARGVNPEIFSGFTQTVDDHGRVGISILVKDGIAPWKSPPTSTMIRGYGEPFEVQINPSESDLRSAIKDSERGEVRFILDRNNNIYVWDASKTIHASVQTALSIDPQDWGMWALQKGKLVDSWRYPSDGNAAGVKEAVASAKDILDLVKNAPASRAALAADIGLLHLIEAFDKTGINVEILPTAINIDKRVGEGHGGYSASLERQAGLGAVAALDDYRARVIEAIQAGKQIPDFEGRIPKEVAKDYDESKHPRDDRGRWTSGGGSSDVSSDGQEGGEENVLLPGETGYVSPEDKRNYRDDAVNDFPNLSNFDVVKRPTRQYNCYASAMGDTKRWWGPGHGSTFWPADVKQDLSVASFDDLFVRKLGGEAISEGLLDVAKTKPKAGTVRLALFSIDRPTHLVRQLSNGKWVSKNGGYVTLLLDDIRELEGGVYGNLAKIYRLPTAKWKTLRDMR